MQTRTYFRLIAAAAALVAAALANPVAAAPKEPKAKDAKSTSAVETIGTSESNTKLGKQTKIRLRVGAEITASRGACRNITAMVTVPLECPEQHVEIISEDFSPEVQEVTYRPLPGGEVKQMVISVPRLADGATAHAIVI